MYLRARLRNNLTPRRHRGQTNDVAISVKQTKKNKHHVNIFNL